MIELYANNTDTTIAQAVPTTGTGSTTVVLASGTGAQFPQPGSASYPPGETTYFRLSVTDATTQTKHEIMWCTARSGDTCTVLRGQEGTTVQAWSPGDIAYNANTAGTEGVQVQVEQLQCGYLTYAVATGSNTSISATLPVNALGNLYDGLKVLIKVPVTNGAGYQLNFNSRGSVPVVDDLNKPIAPNSLIGGSIYEFIYNSSLSSWQVNIGRSNQFLYLLDSSVTANTVHVSTGLGLDALATGYTFFIKVANSCTGASTLTIDNISGIQILTINGTATQAGALVAGGTYRFVYNGTQVCTDAANILQDPIGTIKIYNGSASSITTVFGPGWQVADGTNGTPDLRNRMILGAGNSYTLGTSGGANAVALGTAQLPTHNHGINDPGHKHSVGDPGHSHYVNDPGHNHSINQNPHTHGVGDPGHQHLSPWGEYTGQNYNAPPWTPPWGTDNANNHQGNAYPMDNNNSFGWTSPSGTGIGIAAATIPISNNGAYTGIYLSAAGTGISIGAAGTGISTQNSGNGQAFSILNPYYAGYYIIRVF